MDQGLKIDLGGLFLGGGSDVDSRHVSALVSRADGRHKGHQIWVLCSFLLVPLHYGTVIVLGVWQVGGANGCIPLWTDCSANGCGKRT